MILGAEQFYDISIIVKAIQCVHRAYPLSDVSKDIIWKDPFPNGACDVRQFMWDPPLTFSVCPVILDARSDTKNVAALPISSGLCARPRGVRSAT